MEQGALSDNCYTSLEKEEIDSLSKIREHYKKKKVSSFSLEEALSFVDRSYEAMGRHFRNRLNNETKKYGRYSGELDGVFLLIKSALRFYETAHCFSTTPREASDIYKQHKKLIENNKKLSSNGFSDVTAVINRILPTACADHDIEQLEHAINQLGEIQTIVNEQINQIDFDKRCHTAVEYFVESVCSHLVWNANIKPTKPLTDGYLKTPLLRFLEIFYQVGACSVLSKVYDRERKRSSSERIGALFIEPL